MYLSYQEGIHLVENQPIEKIAERAFLYYNEDQKIRALEKDFLDNFQDLTNDRQAQVLAILRRGGMEYLEIYTYHNKCQK